MRDLVAFLRFNSIDGEGFDIKIHLESRASSRDMFASLVIAQNFAFEFLADRTHVGCC